MHARIVTVGVVVAASLITAGCGGESGGETTPSASQGSVAAAESATAPKGGITTAAAPAGSPARTAAVAPRAVETRYVAPAASANGVPVPSPEALAVYISDLDAIDPAIVAGRPSAMSLWMNSLSVCRALANNRDLRQLQVSTMQSFGNEQIQLTREQGTQVIDAIRRDLCTPR